jgi:hypothetical protein
MRNHLAGLGRLKAAAAYLVLALTLPGCQGCPGVTLKTVELQPTDTKTGFSGPAGSSGWCLSRGDVPPSTFSAGPGQVMVGFDDFFRAGSDPFPCDDLRATDFRAGILFDLGQFDSVTAAELLFDTQASVSRSGGESIGQIPGTSHATTLGVGTQAFSPRMPADNEASLPGGPAITVGVSGQVRDWIDHSRPNFGFVISGPRGPVDFHNPPKDNDAKVSWYGNVRLRVTYNPAQNPRAPQ